MSDLLLGIDVGTTLCKAAVVGVDGLELAHGSSRTPWRPVPTGAEADPRALVDAAVAAALGALERAPEGRVLAVGVTGMAETGVLLGAKGEPAAPAIAWHDARGEDEAARLAQELGVERFVETTGLPPSRLCSLAKVRWLRDHDERAAAAVRWLNVSEWVVRSLGGDELAELSLASRTGLLDLRRGAWWRDALEWAGVPESFLPEPMRAGTPAGRASAVPSLAGALLAVAGHDHLCASVGAGATAPGDLFDSCGSAEALVRAVPPPLGRAEIRRSVACGVTVGWHVYGGQQALLGGFLSGLGLQRFLDLLGVGDDGREALDEAALAEGPGPLVVSGITADTSTLAGIGAAVAPGRVWRAALEAAERHAAGIRATIESVSGPSERLVVSGGWARGAARQAVKRELLGAFEQAPVIEAGARGAALIAGVAAGMYEDVAALPAPESTQEVIRS